ncbi:hypothetical protein N658DRAFT_94162 [Parathielavia hyrcaniae]|uniref:Uncharacterized protein n=1 Tax=Parathielavia hyrcaniae TaxID=113614 RepID=A0AAN6Q2V5_9PEZI|nr:hypothetical protein N658DRAFT_94162 [Parathielavia hyrcaniae]
MMPCLSKPKPPLYSEILVMLSLTITLFCFSSRLTRKKSSQKSLHCICFRNSSSCVMTISCRLLCDRRALMMPCRLSARLRMLSLSRFVVGSSRASRPQWMPKLSAREMLGEARLVSVGNDGPNVSVGC